MATPSRANTFTKLSMLAETLSEPFDHASAIAFKPVAPTFSNIFFDEKMGTLFIY